MVSVQFWKVNYLSQKHSISIIGKANPVLHYLITTHKKLCQYSNQQTHVEISAIFLKVKLSQSQGRLAFQLACRQLRLRRRVCILFSHARSYPYFKAKIFFLRLHSTLRLLMCWYVQVCRITAKTLGLTNLFVTIYIQFDKNCLHWGTSCFFGRVGRWESNSNANNTD